MKEPRSCQSKLLLLKTGPFSGLSLPTPTRLLAAVTCQSPTAFLPTKATTRLNRRQQQRGARCQGQHRLGAKQQHQFCLSPLFQPQQKRFTSVLQCLRSLSHCFGEGARAVTQRVTAVSPGAWDAKPSARNLSHSMTAASHGDTQQSCSSDQQHLLDKHSGTRLKTKNV